MQVAESPGKLGETEVDVHDLLVTTLSRQFSGELE